MVEPALRCPDFALLTTFSILTSAALSIAAEQVKKIVTDLELWNQTVVRTCLTL